MNYDIVGTLSQPSIALNSLLWGMIAGICIAIFKVLFLKGKISLVVTDFLSTVALGVEGGLFCFVYTKGVIWAYVIFCNLCGFLSAQFFTYKIFSIVKKLFKTKKQSSST